MKERVPGMPRMQLELDRRATLKKMSCKAFWHMFVAAILNDGSQYMLIKFERSCPNDIPLEIRTQLYL